MTRGLLVELAGLPGAGKSTVAEAVGRALAARGVAGRVADARISAARPRAARSRSRLLLAAAEALGHPRRTATLLVAVLRLAPPSARDAVAGSVQWLAVSRVSARSQGSPGVHLLQEGVVQTAWTLALRAGGSREALVDLCGRRVADSGQLLVVVEAPVEVASARLATRTSRHSRTQGLDEEDRVRELRSGAGLLAHLVDRVDTAGRPTLRVVNDGSLTPDQLAAQVVGWLAPRILQQEVEGVLRAGAQ